MGDDETKTAAPRGPIVLVASDFSDGSDEAILQADRWARETKAKLVACHVVPYYVRVAMLFPQMHESDAEKLVELEKIAADKLAERVTELTGREPSDFEVVVDSGAPDAAIVKLAEEAGASLVVTGGHGESAIPRLLLGRVAERVISYAHSPVLVARKSPEGARVLAATDLSPRSLPAVSVGAEIATRTGKKLTVLYAVESVAPAPWMTRAGGTDAVRDQAVKTLEDRLRELGVTGEVLVVVGSPAAQIIATAERVGADLVVVATLGRTGLARLAIGSVALAVARAAPCSVLVLRG